MSKTRTAPTKTTVSSNGQAAAGPATKRLPVMKTYKLYIGGKFPRTESGRYYQPKGADGKPVAYSDPKHFCRTCHSYAAVRVDCFECHASRPDEKAKAADASDNSLSALSAHVAEMKK